MVSHADLHLLPEGELPRAHREQIERILRVQERAPWQGSDAVRFLESGGVTFVRRPATGRPAGTLRSAGLVGFGLFCCMVGLVAANGDSFVSGAFYVLGGVGVLGGAWGLAGLPKRLEALRSGPTRLGLYLFDDALVTLDPPVAVIHRPERCGAHLIAKGAIRGIDVAEDGDAGGGAFCIVLRVRKTTGEIVQHRLEAYPSSVRAHPLKALIDAWRDDPPSMPSGQGS